jgi:hypothetical protein
MRRRVSLALALSLAIAAPAHAVISVGQPANPFTKNSLVGSSSGPAISLSDYPAEVKILFVLGFN